MLARLAGRGAALRCVATFRAVMLDAPGAAPRIASLSEAELPAEGEVDVEVEHSTVNFKDGMVLSHLGKMVAKYPHVPGIDFAGTVAASRSPAFQEGDKVVLTGWRVGEVWWGGLSERARVRADWLLPLPAGLSTRHAMTLATAGLSAGLGLAALEDYGRVYRTPEEPIARDRPILVTGAAGGVGSVAVALLAGAGYRVTAATGRVDEAGDFLRSLGATDVIPREEVATPPRGPLGSEKWAGVIDCVGGKVLGASTRAGAQVIPHVAYWGGVAVIGNTAGVTFSTNVIPFLLRGVGLLGVESATCPNVRRSAVWRRLAETLSAETLERLTTDVVPLADVPALGKAILEGKVRGRVVVDVNA